MRYHLAVTLASAALFSSAILGGSPAAAQATEVALVEEVSGSSITGNVKTNVIATPAVTVGFVGVDLTVDPEYTRQRAECVTAALVSDVPALHGAVARRARPADDVKDVGGRGLAL